MPTKQLLLSKYLFRKGENALKDSNSFSAGLAISLFQDSVELLLWTIAKEYPVTIKDKDGFDKLWDTVNKIEKDGNVVGLSYQARMIELNKARVNFKHYGNLPASSEAEKFRDYVGSFLTSTCADYFNMSFDDISLADLINDNDSREKIKEAVKCLKNKNAQGCIINCAHAGYIVFGSLDKILPRVDNNFMDAAMLFGGEASHSANRVFKYLGSYLNSLRDLNFVSLLSVNLADYLRFKAVTPYVFRSQNGNFQTTMRTTNFSDADAIFCIDFVTNCALAVEEKLR